MDRNLSFRLITILVVAGICLFLLYPSYIYFSKYRSLNEDEVAQLGESDRRQMTDVAKKSIKLGLDLQGGMHLVLELDRASLKDGDIRDAQDRVLEVLSTRVDQYGVTEPTLARQGNSRVLVQLPGIDDPERAKTLVGGTAKLSFRMVREPQITVDVIQQIDAALAGKDIPDSSAAAQNAAADSTETGDATTTPEGEAMEMAATEGDTTQSSLFPELDAEEGAPETEEDTTMFSQLFVHFDGGALYVPNDGYRVERAKELIARPEVQKILKRDKSSLFWSDEPGPPTADGLPTRLLYLVENEVRLEGERLTDARVGPNPNRPGAMLINFRLDRRGARKFSKVTADNIGRQLAIILDQTVKSAPRIDGRIPSGDGQITGSFSDTEAKDLAIVLRAGALPVALNFIEERTVGPTLGADSLSKGLMAALVGLGVTALFLLVYYQFGGLLALFALIMNMIIVLAALAVLGAALSLPGIAGLVLSVAMAVDANVLIFERIREELLKSKTVSASIDAGYKNALSAIVDSNLTTLFAGVVLLYFGTGPIKGFAVTLCIGILASMFTALFMTRFFFDLVTRRRRLEKLSI
jgi:protein-export membrane protein SecD